MTDKPPVVSDAASSSVSTSATEKMTASVMRSNEYTKKQKRTLLQSSLALMLADLRGAQTDPPVEIQPPPAKPKDVATAVVEEPPPLPALQLPEFDLCEKLTLLVCERAEFAARSDFNNFLKGCKWSPDGRYILTNSEDRMTRVFDFSESEVNLNVLSRRRNGELVYDYCWYPLMREALPDYSVYVVTCRDQPIHMVDAQTGLVRCTYRAINHFDELSAAQSVSFSIDGQRLYAGFNKAIRVFDVARPGRQIETKKTVLSGTTGQTGIISCLAMCPTIRGLYAAGSYGRSVALYSDETESVQTLFLGHAGGVTHLQFSPDGNYLLSGGRKDPEILGWDMRKPGNVLFTARRTVGTNQRIYFELDRSGRVLMSGSSTNEILAWDLSSTSIGAVDSEQCLPTSLCISAHESVVNGVSLHPSLPLVASVSGERIIDDPLDDEVDDVEGPTFHQVVTDNSLKIWRCGKNEG